MQVGHLETRAKLKAIPRRSTFNALLEDSTLDDIDKQILQLHYLEHKDLMWIAVELGYSEATIKARHRNALRKLGPLLV